MVIKYSSVVICMVVMLFMVGCVTATGGNRTTVRHYNKDLHYSGQSVVYDYGSRTTIRHYDKNLHYIGQSTINKQNNGGLDE